MQGKPAAAASGQLLCQRTVDGVSAMGRGLLALLVERTLFAQLRHAA